MTDEQIIKASEYCSTDVRENTCPKCAFYKKHRCSTLMLNAVSDLINRQKAEIIRLKNRNAFLENEYKNQGELFWERVKIKQSEAIKEFAEKVKKEICKNTYAGFNKKGNPVNIWEAKAGFKDIDNLVKEMTEVQK